MTTNLRRQRLVDAIIEIAAHDMNEWGTGGIGVSLLSRYFEGSWVTASELANGSPLSAAQVRRRLNALVEKGMVIKLHQETGQHVYMAHPEAAERSAQMIEDRVTLQNATTVEAS